MNKQRVNDATCDLVRALEEDTEAMGHIRGGEVLFPIPFRAADGTVLQVLCGSESVIKMMWEAAK